MPASPYEDNERANWTKRLNEQNAYRDPTTSALPTSAGRSFNTVSRGLWPRGRDNGAESITPAVLEQSSDDSAVPPARMSSHASKPPQYAAPPPPRSRCHPRPPAPSSSPPSSASEQSMHPRSRERQSAQQRYVPPSAAGETTTSRAADQRGMRVQREDNPTEGFSVAVDDTRGETAAKPDLFFSRGHRTAAAATDPAANAPGISSGAAVVLARRTVTAGSGHSSFVKTSGLANKARSTALVPPDWSSTAVPPGPMNRSSTDILGPPISKFLPNTPGPTNNASIHAPEAASLSSHNTLGPAGVLSADSPGQASIPSHKTRGPETSSSHETPEPGRAFFFNTSGPTVSSSASAHSLETSSSQKTPATASLSLGNTAGPASISSYKTPRLAISSSHHTPRPEIKFSAMSSAQSNNSAHNAPGPANIPESANVARPANVTRPTSDHYAHTQQQQRCPTPAVDIRPHEWMDSRSSTALVSHQPPQDSLRPPYPIMSYAHDIGGSATRDEVQSGADRTFPTTQPTARPQTASVLPSSGSTSHHQCPTCEGPLHGDSCSTCSHNFFACRACHRVLHAALRTPGGTPLCNYCSGEWPMTLWEWSHWLYRCCRLLCPSKRGMIVVAIGPMLLWPFLIANLLALSSIGVYSGPKNIGVHIEELEPRLYNFVDVISQGQGAVCAIDSLACNLYVHPEAYSDFFQSMLARQENEDNDGAICLQIPCTGRNPNARREDEAQIGEWLQTFQATILAIIDAWRELDAEVRRYVEEVKRNGQRLDALDSSRESPAWFVHHAQQLYEGTAVVPPRHVSDRAATHWVYHDHYPLRDDRSWLIALGEPGWAAFFLCRSLLDRAGWFPHLQIVRRRRAAAALLVTLNKLPSTTSLRTLFEQCNEVRRSFPGGPGAKNFALKRLTDGKFLRDCELANLQLRQRDVWGVFVWQLEVIRERVGEY